MTYIGDGAFPAGEQFTIYGYRGTTAHGFALNNGNTFVPLDDCDIKVSIKEENIESYDTACGTVVERNEEGEVSGVLESFTSTLTVTPDNDRFTNVTLDLTLPEGFSFEPNELVTKKTMDIGSVNDERDVVTDPIYPIYLSDASEGKAYKLTVEISAVDSLGEQENGVDNPIFFEADQVTNSFTSNGPALSGENYDYSLGSAAGSGTSYRQDTAELMALLSDLAYSDTDLKHILTSKLGFSCFEQYGISNWNTKACGRYIASKKIIKDGELKNLVYIICRGTAPAGEWIGDFQVGFLEQINDHEGFRVAAKYIEDELSKYCERYEMTQDGTIILVTGHSKGAAAANMVGNWLNNESKFAHKDNIGVYTFATPTVSRDVVSEADGLAGNENIFNFVNYQDIIRNAPSMQYYGRYGHTTIFGIGSPASGSNTHSNEYGSYTAIGAENNFTLTELLNGVMYGVDARKYPTPVLFGIALCTALNITTATDGTMPDIGADAMTAHSMAGYYTAVKNGASGADAETVRRRTEAALAYYNDTIAHNAALISAISPASVIINAFKCPINVYVYDGAGNVVASIVDMEAKSDDVNVVVTTYGETRYVIYSKEYEDDYTIRVEGYDNGSVTHMVQTVSSEGVESVQKRSGIPVSTGEVIEVGGDGLISVGGESPESVAVSYTAYDEEHELDILFSEYSFTDVTNPADWFHDPVYAAANANVVAGNPDGTFRPYDTLTWAQTVTFAVRLAQYNAGERVYTAADQTAVWYEVYTDYAMSHGIIDAIPPDPNAVITRGDAAVIFAAVLGDAEQVNDVADEYFTDVASTDDAYDSVYALSRAGITNGKGGGVFDPSGSFLRNEVATIVARMAGLVAKAKI